MMAQKKLYEFALLQKLGNIFKEFIQLLKRFLYKRALNIKINNLNPKQI